MTTQEFQKFIAWSNPFTAYGKEYAKGKTIAQFWAECKRADFMLCLLDSAKIAETKFAAAAVVCAEYAKPQMDTAEQLAALDAAHAFSRGKITKEELVAVVKRVSESGPHYAKVARVAALPFENGPAAAAVYGSGAFEDKLWLTEEVLTRLSEMADKIRQVISVDEVECEIRKIPYWQR